MDRLRGINAGILSDLRELNLSEEVRIRDTRAVAGGSYGDVSKGRYEAVDGVSFTVAVKKLRISSDRDVTLFFEKEVYVWSKLRHPNILALLGYTFHSETGYPLFVSPWMENGSLVSYMKSNPHYDVLRLVHGIAKGLEYLHSRGVVHADIKPANILVTASGDAVMCDFGYSRMIEASRSLGLLSSNIKGTTRYTAFELLKWNDQARNSTASDVWSFGMTVYELLTQQAPYADIKYDALVIVAINNGSLPQLPSNFDARPWPEPNVKQFLWSICERCWNVNPEGRMSMAEVLTSIRATRHLPTTSSLENPEEDAALLSEKKPIEDIPTLQNMYASGYFSTLTGVQPIFTPNGSHLNRISLYQGDITNLEIDVIVFERDGTSHNPTFARDGSISSAIHIAAGQEFVNESGTIRLDYGDVTLTGGYGLSAKHVIHVRGPGPICSQQDAIANSIQLASCYRKGLEIANNHAMKSIAFSSISTNDGEYRIGDAARIALKETRQFLDVQQASGDLHLNRIIFVVPNRRHLHKFEKLIPSIFPAPDISDN